LSVSERIIMTNWIHLSNTTRTTPGVSYNVTVKTKWGDKFVTTLMFMGGDEWDTSEVIFLDKSDYTITHYAELPEPAND
jgi:hypothetical protein